MEGKRSFSAGRGAAGRRELPFYGAGHRLPWGASLADSCFLGQGTHIYPGTHPNTVFVQLPGTTAVTNTGTGPNEVNADISLTMIHAPPSAPGSSAAFLRTQPLNFAPPSARQLTKLRFFLSIQ